AGTACFEPSLDPESITMTSNGASRTCFVSMSMTRWKCGRPFLTGMMTETSGRSKRKPHPNEAGNAELINARVTHCGDRRQPKSSRTAKHDPSPVETRPIPLHEPGGGRLEPRG